MTGSTTATPLTGRKVFFITAAFFGTVIAANVTLAVQAVRTFPGLEVGNSYIASQTFNAELAAQKALGWALKVAAGPDRLTLVFTDAAGRPVEPVAITASIGRATEVRDDLVPEFVRVGAVYEAPVALASGKWVLRIEAEAEDGTIFRQRVAIFLKG